MTTEDDLTDMWDVIRPPPPPAELEKRRCLKMMREQAEQAKENPPPEMKECACGRIGTWETHFCPYAADVRGQGVECDCCAQCTQDCADDI